MSLQSNNTYAQEQALHAVTRQDNDARLRPILAQLRNGEAVDALEPLAKAYLGLFLDIDNTFSPPQRLRLLVNEDIGDAVTEGFVSVLTQSKLPAPAEIGAKMAHGERFEVGYIVLAAMDCLYSQRLAEIDTLSEQALSSAVCFHFANTSPFHDQWAEKILQTNNDKLAGTLEAFWMSLIKQGTDYIPGLHDYLDGAQVEQIHSNKVQAGKMLLPVLNYWSGYKKKLLLELLQTAIRYTDKAQLLSVANTVLARDALDPYKKILWLATVHVLQADADWQILLDYTRRSKEKILPLLDFTFELVTPVKYEVYRISPHALAGLLRVTAPKFPPHYDSFGNLTDNARKTLRIFYEYAILREDISASVMNLEKVRVMKIVKVLLKECLLLNQRVNAGDEIPEFEDFISSLSRAGKLTGRKGWFD